MSLEPQAGISSHFLVQDRGILPLGSWLVNFHLILGVLCDRYGCATDTALRQHMTYTYHSTYSENFFLVEEEEEG